MLLPPPFFTFYLSPKNSFSFLSSRSAGCDSKSFKYWGGFRFEYLGATTKQGLDWRCSHTSLQRAPTCSNSGVRCLATVSSLPLRRVTSTARHALEHKTATAGTKSKGSQKETKGNTPASAQLTTCERVSRTGGRTRGGRRICRTPVMRVTSRKSPKHHTSPE